MRVSSIFSERCFITRLYAASVLSKEKFSKSFSLGSIRCTALGGTDVLVSYFRTEEYSIGPAGHVNRIEFRFAAMRSSYDSP